MSDQEVHLGLVARLFEVKQDKHITKDSNDKENTVDDNLNKGFLTKMTNKGSKSGFLINEGTLCTYDKGVVDIEKLSC
jgi:hypothetical protein